MMNEGMKYAVSIFAIFLFLFLNISCTDDETPLVEEEVDVILSVNATEFEFTSEGGTHTLEITSNEVWKIEYENTLWASPSQQTSKGDATITITADENPSIAPRTMGFLITSEGAEDINITILQDGRDHDPTEPDNPDFIEPDQAGMRDITSLQLSEEMGIGWNLGNSLEAIIVSGDDYSGGETSWGNPMVNEQLIQAVKAAGFNTIRIPVSYSHMLEDQGSYKIKYEWKLRVAEVVNYVLENDMYAMINIHWDGGWMNQPTYENKEEINIKLAAFWKQIAIHFRDYDDRLIFAGTNEVLVANNYGTPTAENTEVQNSFNQTFVNTVRATGGRNAWRHLVVQGYNTNIEHTVNHLTIPVDETDDRMMVEVHYYDPYQFTLQEDGNVYLWGKEHQGKSAHSGWGDEAWVEETFNDMKTNFVDKGYPVILGEYGAILRTELQGEAYNQHVEARNHYLNYVTKTALKNGMVPVYWDNGYSGNKGFGLFNRATGEQIFSDAIEAITSAKE